MVNRYDRFFPNYPDDSDFTTNAPSYYEDLARKNKLIKLLAKKIWEYENTLNESLEEIEKRLTDYITENDSLMNERLENWDKRIEEMPEEMRSLFVEWLNDGTLEQIINHDVLGNKADQSDLDETNVQLEETITNLNEREININNFGAIGDGDPTNASVNLTAIQQAIEQVLLIDGTLFIPSGDYCVAETVFMPAIHVNMVGSIVYTGDLDVPGIVMGEPGSRIHSKRITLRVKRDTQSNWLDENCIGIKIINAETSDIHIEYSIRFTIGVQFIGANGGFAYNTVKLGTIRNNKIAIDLTGETVDGGIGWCNENLYIGGRITNFSPLPRDVSRVGIRITRKNGSLSQNNNVFLKPSIELHDSVESLPVLIEHGVNNTFINLRNESNTAPTMRVLNTSTENTLSTGYGWATIDDQSDYPLNFVESARRPQDKFLNRLIKKVDDLPRIAEQVDTDRVHIPSLFTTRSNSESVSSDVPGLTIADNYLEIPSTRGIGFFVNTNYAKHFLANIDGVDGEEGRIYVVCYDKLGNILDSSQINHPYVKGSVYRDIASIDYFGGGYRSSSPVKQAYFKVSDDVSYVKIVFSGGSISAKVRSISLYSDKDASTWLGY